jgi:3-oxoadipate enol-lactonase
MRGAWGGLGRALLTACALQAAAAPVQLVDTGRAMLRYDLSGRGARTLVLLHEMGVTLESFEEVTPDLARDHRVLRYDLRGFGLSEKLRGALTIDDEVADLEGLLERLDIRGPVTLVGGAIGGSIAVRFAARHPERVTKLVITSPVMSANPPAAAPAVPAAGAGPRVDNSPAAVIEREGVRAYLDQQLETVYPTPLRTPRRLALFRAMQLATDPESRIVTTRTLGAVDLSADLRALRCPTLVVSTLLFNNGGTARAVAAAIPGARYVELRTGHYAALESPELLLPVLRDFIDR